MNTTTFPSLRATLAATLLAAATGLSACAATSEGGEDPAEGPIDLSTVTLNVGDQIAGTETILSAAGQLDDIPYSITWSSFTSGPPQVEALNAGQIDFAITGNIPPIIGGPTRTKVVSSYNNEGVGEAILVAPDSGIDSVADLKGKSIAVARGSSAHGHVIKQFEQAGLSDEDVTLNFLQPNDATAAFENGQVDAWAIWDPYTALAEVEGAQVLATASGLVETYGFGIASDDALADPAKEAALEDLLARVRTAYEWVHDNPDAWAETYAAETGFDPEAARVNTRSQRLPVPLDDTVNDNQNALIRSFADVGLLEEFDFATIVDRRFETWQ